MHPRVLSTIVIALLSAAAPASDYEQSVKEWRVERELALQRDDGWLTVAGLFWLKEGENTAGAGASNDIVLPPGSAPERVGTFVVRDGQITFRAVRGAGVSVGSKPVRTLEMQPDSAGAPTVIQIRDLSLSVIQRGGRYGVRLRDKNSKYRREFQGLDWFPVDEAYRVAARFVPYDPPKPIAILNVLGDVEEAFSPGYVVFTIGGRECQLDPVPAGERLWFIFGDQTSGKETYGGGRFLYADAPEDGNVILDFNKAYNPPCAFTPYSTCPLPPRQNRLPVPISAGEKAYLH